jgi:calcineurin-like phosphoesterase family protein
MIYFSSDWHLSHANILKYDKRPFKNIGEMNGVILGEFCKTVGKGDTFYFLGDFCFNKELTKLYLQTLEATGADLFFIKGNHDHSDTIKLYEKFGTYLGEQYSKIIINGTQVVLNHFAMRIWDRSHHGSYHLYGHCHDKLERDPWGRSMDVGIMTSYRINKNWKPFEWGQLFSILAKRQPKIIDHHGS